MYKGCICIRGKTCGFGLERAVFIFPASESCILVLRKKHGCENSRVCERFGSGGRGEE